LAKPHGWLSIVNYISKTPKHNLEISG